MHRQNPVGGFVSKFVLSREPLWLDIGAWTIPLLLRVSFNGTYCKIGMKTATAIGSIQVQALDALTDYNFLDNKQFSPTEAISA